MRAATRALVVLCFLAAVPGTALRTGFGQEDRGDLVHAEHGFKLARPGPPWTVAEVGAAPDAHYALKVQRSDRKLEVSFTVYIADAEGARDAKALRDLAEQRWRADPSASSVTTGTEKVSGEDAPFVRSVHAFPGGSYVTRQVFLLRNDSLYVLVSLWADGEDHEKELAALSGTFAFVPLADAVAHATAQRLRRLARRCGSEIEWARDWAEAARRAQSEKKLVVIPVEIYHGFAIEPVMPSATFMDSDVVALMKERFVCLRWHAGMGAPFERAEVYGLGPFTFGQSILVASPEGRIVAEAVSANPFYFDAFARGVLAEHGEATGSPVRDPKDPEELLRRGEVEAAMKLLAKPDSARAWRLRAKALARARKGEDALAAIGRARELGAEVGLDEGLVLARLGRFEEARRALALHVSAHPDDAEARYWLAACRGMLLGLEPIRGELEELTKDHPESRWASRAAAFLLGRGIMSGIDQVAWADDAIFAGVAPSASAVLTVKEVARAERDAVAHLLKTQLPSGAWASSYAFFGGRTSSDVAIASIAGLGLLRFRDRPEVARAVERARDFVLSVALANDARLTFDNTIWGEVFALRFLSRCAKDGVGDRAQLEKALAAIVRSVSRTQLSTGGWAYVRMIGLEDSSIGFVTAAALLALLDARSASVEVPDLVLSKAAGCLAALRRPSGAFDYASGLREEGAGADRESSPRSPLCALALLRAGKGDRDALEKALAIYLEHRTQVRLERGKGLCHTAPEGTASYYLIFGYAFAAEALAELPANGRKTLTKAIVEDVLYLRTEDGGFLDNLAVGRAYGAGMALRAFELLRERDFK